jgi:hypothetical protein
MELQCWVTARRTVANHCHLVGPFQDSRPTTVEDSMEVITELIQEIQKSEDHDVSSHVSVGRIPPLPTSNTRTSLRVSLARKNKAGVTSANFLLPL